MSLFMCCEFSQLGMFAKKNIANMTFFFFLIYHKIHPMKEKEVANVYFRPIKNDATYA